MRSFFKSFNLSVYLLCFLCFLCLFIISCYKNNNSEKTDDNNSIVESEISETGTLVFGENRKKLPPEQGTKNDQKGFTEIEMGDIKGQLFPYVSKIIIPEDMVIGPLLAYDYKNISSNTFLYAIVTFFDDAIDGVINEDVLHPSWKNSISILFNNRLSEQNYTIRIGDIVKKSGISRTNIRLISETGRVSGEITADKYEDKWLISNISIDFIQLDDVYLKEEFEFNPLSYSNIMLNY